MGLLNFKTIQYLTIIFCCSSISNYNEARASSTEKNLNTGEKTYYVKGITCENYKGSETDCNIKKSIESKTKYIVFKIQNIRCLFCNNKILLILN
jgi:hypothetical protein